jgi:fructokinase
MRSAGQASERAPGSPGASVVVLGEALVDVFPSTASHGPQTLAAGAPFNVACALAALGVPTLMLSRVGADDADAQIIRTAAQRFGLPWQGFQSDAQRPTGRVTVHLQDDGRHRFEILENAAWDHLDAAQAQAALQGQQPRLMYFGTLAQRAERTREALRSVLSASTALRYLDLNLRDGADNRTLSESSLHLAHWVKVNDDELAQLIDWFAPEKRELSALMQRFKLDRVIVTRGPAGYAAYRADGVCDLQGEGVPLSKPVDTVGAGDAFSAVVLAGKARGLPLAPTLSCANQWAARVCEQAGALPQTVQAFDALRRRLDQLTPLPIIEAP